MGEDNSDDTIDQDVDENVDKKPRASDQPVADELDEAQGEQAGEEPVEDDLGARLEATEAMIETLKDQALRGQAEAENARRRALRDVENAHKYALEKFSADLLPVIDSLEKAVENVVQDSGSEESASAMSEGVELSLKLFGDVLEKFGIGVIDPLGEPFDPEHHEAMAMVENPDSEPNSVLDVMQKGYTLNGRLVRAAMVVVSKAPAASS